MLPDRLPTCGVREVEWALASRGESSRVNDCGPGPQDERPAGSQSTATALVSCPRFLSPSPAATSYGKIRIGAELETATKVVEKFKYWRRGWDLNPRDGRPPAGFQDRCLQPLGHPSIAAMAWRNFWLITSMQASSSSFLNDLQFPYMSHRRYRFPSDHGATSARRFFDGARATIALDRGTATFQPLFFPKYRGW